MEGIIKVTIEEAQKLWRFSELKGDYGLLRAEIGEEEDYGNEERHVIIYNKKLNVAYLSTPSEYESNTNYYQLMIKFSNMKKVLTEFKLNDKLYDYFFRDGVIRTLNNIEIRKKAKELKKIFGWSYNFCKEFLLNNFFKTEDINKSKIKVSDISISNFYDYKGIKVISISKNYSNRVYVYNFGAGKDIIFNFGKINDARKRNKFQELSDNIIKRNQEEFKLSHLIYSFLYLENKENSFSVNSPKYKKLEKLLSSDKLLEDKYFLIKCFISKV
jgi:hypothetical protein